MKKNALRSLIIVIALTLALSSLGASSAQRKANSQVEPTQAQGSEGSCRPNDIDANSALTRLKDGNKRWLKIPPPPPPIMKRRNWDDERKATATCQRPHAVVIACMDSRVPPELIFDQGLGEIFVIRVAGPVLNEDELASLEYALVKINVKLVLVLGHTDCGAVKGAVDRVKGVYLPELLDKIEPAIRFVSDKYNHGVRIPSDDKTNLSRVSLENARIVQSRILSKPALLQPGVQVKWGLYHVANGRVDVYPADVVQ